MLGKKSPALFSTLTDTTGDGKKDLLEISTTRINDTSVNCTKLMTQTGSKIPTTP